MEQEASPGTAGKSLSPPGARHLGVCHLCVVPRGHLHLTSLSGDDVFFGMNRIMSLSSEEVCNSTQPLLGVSNELSIKVTRVLLLLTTSVSLGMSHFCS